MGVKMQKDELARIIRDAIGPEAAARRDASIEAATKNAEGLNKGQDPETPPKKKRVKRDDYGESKLGQWIIAMALAGGHKNYGEAAKIAEANGAPDVAKALQATTFGDGGALVPEEFSDELIEFLRQQVVVRRMGARVIPMSATTLDMGRQNTSATATYEAEGVNITASQLGTDQVKLVARKLVALTPISNDLIRRAAFAADALVRDDLTGAAAERADLAFIRGDGTSNTPKGIRNIVDAANVFASAGTTTANIIDDLGRAAREVQESQVPMRKRGWLFSSRTEWDLRTLLDANSNFVFRDEMNGGNLLGFPFAFTDQIPNTLGGGSDESEVYFAEFSDLVIGEALGVQVEVFPGGTYDDAGTLRSGISRDETVVRLITEHDFNMRHTDTAAVITGVQWGT